jgi:hypothetical protein
LDKKHVIFSTALRPEKYLESNNEKRSQSFEVSVTFIPFLPTLDFAKNVTKILQCEIL